MIKDEDDDDDDVTHKGKMIKVELHGIVGKKESIWNVIDKLYLTMLYIDLKTVSCH